MATKNITVSLALAKFNKDRHSLSLSADNLNGKMNWDSIYLVSHITGKTVEFIRMPYEHPLHDQDGWDGEIAAYIPVTDIPKVEALYVSFMI